MPSELECCPRCGALPCDWVNNPHHTPPAVPNFNKCADGDEWVDDCHFSPTGFAVWRCEGDRKFCTCKPATQADDALVEVRDAIRTYFPTEMACAAVVCAILPILHRREAAAHAAGQAWERASVTALIERNLMSPQRYLDAIERDQHKEPKP